MGMRSSMGPPCIIFFVCQELFLRRDISVQMNATATVSAQSSVTFVIVTVNHT